jgi:hypothetical protein
MSIFGGLIVYHDYIGLKIREFKPGRIWWILKGDKTS